LIAGRGFAQAPDDTVKFRAGVNLVVVPVVARTKDGQEVADLTKDAFSLFDNGKQIDIQRFTVERMMQNVAVARPAAASGGTGAESPSRPAAAAPMAIPDHFIAYLFDDLAIGNFGDLVWVRDGAMRHMTKLLPGDRAAIFTTSCETMLDFTDDREKLRQTVAKLQVLPIPICGTVVGQQNGSGPISPESLQLSLSATIAGVVQRMSNMPGQRSVVYVGYGISWRPDILEAVIHYALRTKVVIHTLDAHTLNPLGANADYSTAGMTNPQQLQNQLHNLDDALRRLGAQEGMVDLANGTGGTAVNNTNDADGAYRKLATPEWVYMLGFTPGEAAIDKQTNEVKAHKLKVKVKDSRKLSLLARPSYYPPLPGGQQGKQTERRPQP
jgi:VWFA-related protein